MSLQETANSKTPGRYHPSKEWGSPLALYRGLQESLLSIWTQETFEKTMVLKQSPIADILFLSEPDGLRHVLMEHIDDYPKSPIQQRFLKPSLGEGMITAEGEAWRVQRHAANPSFRAEQLTELVPSILDGIEDRFAVWRQTGGTEPVEMRNEMMEMIIEILCLSLFSGVQVDRQALGDAVSYYVDTVGQVDLLDFLNLPTWLPSPKFRKAQWSIDYLHGETNRIVKERRSQDPMPLDLLTMLINGRDDQTGRGFSEQQLKDTLATLLSAGHETTANGMTMTLYLLSEFPWAADKIRQEVAEVIGDRRPEAKDYKHLKFTRMVVEEALRLYPPSSIVIRIAAKDDEICGQKIRKGTTIAISQYVLHRHKQLWDHPDDFDPYRFSPEKKADRHRFSYIPFSIGPRSCIGSTFAMMEMVLATAMIMREFDLQRTNDDDIELQLRITLRLKTPLPMLVTPRRSMSN